MSKLQQQNLDNALMLRAMILGCARWNPLGNSNKVEICCNGLRYVVYLENGMPLLYSVVRHALTQSIESNKSGGITIHH